jgi:uncharacterized membrane protein
VKRFQFLDWTRGLAVLIMIQCHVFNSYTRLDLRQTGTYVLSQFIGGMAAPLFLFMAGMTLAFQMDSQDRREPDARRRWIAALRRGGYVLAIAYAFRISNWASGLIRGSDWHEILKVDILNCMGVSMLVVAVLGIVASQRRAHWAVWLGLAFACVSPLVANLDWTGVPPLVKEYLKPNPARFPLFPWSAYVAFGLAMGAVLKRMPPDRVERLMQWTVVIAFPMVFGAQYFSNIPFSPYEKSDFWIDSPALVLIRTGVSLLMLAAGYLWTEYCAGGGWSWMQALGKTSLLVYWVHVMMVYGDVIRSLRRGMTVGQSVLATVIITLLMVALAAGRLWWRDRQLSVTAAAA